MEVNIKNEEIQWGDIVGIEFTHGNTRVVCSSYNDNSLYINEWIGEEITGKTSVISTLDTDKCLAHLTIFGYTIEFVNNFTFSNFTIQKSQGLIQAGFIKLIKIENNYTVDHIFQQNILLDNELQYLLDNNILEINLSEIK